MTAEHSSPFRVLERLIEDVLRLRRVIAQNDLDARMQDAGYGFNYLIDTPVFRLFAEPARYAGMVAAIPSLTMLDDQDLEDPDAAGPPQMREEAFEDALFANALLTGEYIFKLARTGGAEAVLISPEHANEIYAYIGHLESRSRGLFRLAQQGPMEIFHDLRQIFQTGALPGGEPQDASIWLSSHRQPIIQRISEAAHSPLLAPSRLASLFQRQAIANAAQALGFDEATIAPPFEIVSDWANRISSVKRGNDTAPSASAIEADAITCAQIEMLNRDWKTTKRLHVLITSDRGLHRAFARRKRELETEMPGREIFYPVRDPRQYVPLLNVQAMGGGLSDPEIFKKVAESTRIFTSSFASTDSRIDVDFERDPSSMPGAGAIRRVIQTRAEQHEGGLGDYEDVVRAQLGEIGQHWLEAVESALVAKSDIISELGSREMDIWKTAIIRGALRDDLRSQVSDLGVSFEDLASTSTLLRHEIWAVEQGVVQHEEQAFRNHRKLASAFDHFQYSAFRGSTLNDILSMLRSRRGDMVDILRDMARSRADRAERMFLTGCLSLEIGAWTNAEVLLANARRLERSLRQTDLKREVTFFHCVARRLSASAESYTRNYKLARQDLAGLLDANPRNFDGVRIRNELFALDLSDIAFRRWSKHPVTDALHVATESWRKLGSYHTRLLEPATDDVWRIASKQFILNSCNLAYWHCAANAQLPDNLRAVTEEALRSIEGHAKDYATDTVHGTIYPLLARYALGEGQERERLGEEILHAIDEAVAYDRSAGIAFDLPYVDKAEFQTVREVILFGPDR